MSVQLGIKYRDTISGYTGTAVAVTQRIHSGIQLALERLDSSGKPEEVWFWYGRLKVVPEKVIGF